MPLSGTPLNLLTLTVLALLHLAEPLVQAQACQQIQKRNHDNPDETCVQVSTVMDALVPSAVRIDLQSSQFEELVASQSLATEEEPWFKFPFTCQVGPARPVSVMVSLPLSPTSDPLTGTLWQSGSRSDSHCESFPPPAGCGQPGLCQWLFVSVVCDVTASFILVQCCGGCEYLLPASPGSEQAVLASMVWSQSQQGQQRRA